MVETKKQVSLAAIIAGRFTGGAQIDRARRKIGGLQRPTLVLSRRFGNLRLAALGVTGAFVGLTTIAVAKFIKDSVKAFGDFEASMKRVQVLTGATSQAFNTLSEFALELSGRTIFTARETADAMQVLAQAGFGVSKIFKILPATTSFAAAAQIDFNKAASISTGVLASFRLEVDQLTRVNDVLIGTSIRSKTNILELGEAIRKVGPLANIAGIRLAEANIRGTEAGTALRNIFIRLTKPVGEGAKVIRRLGIRVKQANGLLRPFAQILTELEDKIERPSDLLAIFQQRAGPAMATLLAQGSAAFVGFREELEKLAGITERAAKVQLEGFNGALLKLRATFEELQVRVGRTFGPALIGIIDTFRQFILSAKGSKFIIGLFFDISKAVIRLNLAFVRITKIFEILKKSFGAFVTAGKVAIAFILKNALEAIAAITAFFKPAIDAVIDFITNALNQAIILTSGFLTSLSKVTLFGQEFRDSAAEAAAGLAIFTIDVKKAGTSTKRFFDDVISGSNFFAKVQEKNLASSLRLFLQQREGIRATFGELKRQSEEAAANIALLNVLQENFLFNLEFQRKAAERLKSALAFFGVLENTFNNATGAGKELFKVVFRDQIQVVETLANVFRFLGETFEQDVIDRLEKSIKRVPILFAETLNKAKFGLDDFVVSFQAGFAALAGADAPELVQPLESLISQTQNQLEVLRQFNEARIALDRNTAEAQLALRAGEIARVMQLDEKGNTLLLKREKAKNATILAATSQFFSAVGSVIATQGGANFKLLQAIAIGEAIVNTFLGASQALKEDVPTPIKFLNVAAIIATGLATVAQIASAKPGAAGGGGGGGGGGAAGGGAIAGGAAVGDLQEALDQPPTQQGPVVSINVQGFVGNEAELASKIGEVFREAVGDDVDFNLNQRF